MEQERLSRSMIFRAMMKLNNGKNGLKNDTVKRSIPNHKRVITPRQEKTR